MRSRMTPEQLAALKSSSRAGDYLRDLARKANGHGSHNMGVTRAEKDKADRELEEVVGSGRARRLKEDALRAAGAKPKGLGRFFG